jgi:hypothetical protein
MIGKELPLEVAGELLVTSRANSNKGDKGSSKHSSPRAHRDDNPKESLKDLKLSHKIEKLKKKLNTRKCHELTFSSFLNENSDDRTIRRRTPRRAIKGAQTLS